MELQPPPSSSIQGSVLRTGSRPWHALLVGHLPADAQPGRLIAGGHLLIIYAFALLFEQDFVLPQFVLDDFGRAYHAANAIEFMLSRGDSYPRADVTGRHMSSGEQRTYFLKQVDLARPAAFAGEAIRHRTPSIALDIAVWLDDVPPAWSPLAKDDPRPPALLRRFVPVFRMNAAHLFTLPERVDAELTY